MRKLVFNYPNTFFCLQEVGESERKTIFSKMEELGCTVIYDLPSNFAPSEDLYIFWKNNRGDMCTCIFVPPTFNVQKKGIIDLTKMIPQQSNEIEYPPLLSI
jgi:hypothetical protein